ncbi:DNA polymerase III subunit epsilon [Orrella sp. NBD-18]|uniref:DNA polymerase III subunit epsilon n=1 Tax=Sheuella amnicola TaxID=2707330 RepID=A0A6B2R2L0_9BURK|nr:DNA polymerase III subunit epsilon [Sheuella amnicola]NDY84422.1 DNA polymerase III subunit epsilon [Sheuella amnicola]HBI83328.1 DNA polymerase III subunit epsilon [Alcaligenaceae bacterium]
MRWIILDTETTGLEPAYGHRVIEIGAVEIVNRNITGRDYHTYLKPDRDSDPEALRVHGLTLDFLEDKPAFEDVADEFLEFIAGAELIIHNAPFDVKFLNAELARIGKPPVTTFCEGVTDSLVHAKTLHPGKRNSLDALCDRYGISNAHRTLHGALLDSRLLGEVWLAMTRGQDSLMIDQFDAPEPRGVKAVEQSQDPMELPVIWSSAEELEAHEQYLVSLDKAAKKDSLWRLYEPKA